jgi:hypothetical protein
MRSRLRREQKVFPAVTVHQDFVKFELTSVVNGLNPPCYQDASTIYN